METMPALNVRVTYRSKATTHSVIRTCRGVVVAHYPSDSVVHTDPESGENYIEPHHVGVKVDAPLPDWWPYQNTDVFAPEIGELELENIGL